MNKSLIPSMIFSILILTACLSPSGGVSMPTATSAPSTPSTPSETPSPTPTETPTPESLLPQEVKEKFELAGIDLTKMQNAKYDKDGLHITLADGEVIVLTNTDLQKGIYNGQDNVLQYRDKANQNVIYAFDKESGKWMITPEGQLDLDLKRWGITPEKYNVGYDKDGKIELREKSTNKLIYWDGKWSSDVMVDMVVATNNCQATKFPQDPSGVNRPPLDMLDEYNKYHVDPIMKKIMFSPFVSIANARPIMGIYLTGSSNCWGTLVIQKIIGRADLFWLDATGELQSLEYFDAKEHN